MSKNYETVIGLEVHVELATKTKIFCGCSTAFGGAPNTHTCPVCTGMPGSLPVLNKQVVEYAMAVGLATNCDITQNCKFDRKNYFYPDNPQNYQISQLYLPICRNGKVEIDVDGVKKDIRIHEIHMEEDAGKLVHDPWTGDSLVDFNRSGVPLIEIVSEPDMRSADEMERQIDLIEAGEKVVQETRRWDDTKGASYAMRSKEDAQDYRYFPDPDLVPIEISDEWMDKVRAAQPEFRDEKKVRYKEEYDLPDYDIDIITGSKHLADIFEATIALGSEPKEVSNWLMGETIRLVNESEMDIDDVSFKPEHLAKLIEMIKNNEINRSVGKEVFEKVFKEDIDPAAYVEEHGLKSMNDEGALKATIEEIVANNPKSVEDYKAGKKKAIGFLVGQTMKATQGKANPGIVNKILTEILDNM